MLIAIMCAVAIAVAIALLFSCALLAALCSIAHREEQFRFGLREKD